MLAPLRALPLAALAALTGAAAAAPPPPPPVCPEVAEPPATLHALALATGPVTEHSAGVVAAAGSVFPAISKDGKTIVALFADEEDFTSKPVVTLAVWTNGKKDTHLSVGGSGGRMQPAAAVKAANALLAKTTWRTLPQATACTQGAGDAKRSVAAFAPGVTFSLDAAQSDLSISEHTPAKLAAGKQKVTFEPLGTSQVSHHGCGELTGFATAIWDGASRTVILVPTGNLGGDSCVGATAAERATRFVLP